MNKNIEIQKDKIADFCRRHHICRLAIFGSALWDDFEQDSDIIRRMETVQDSFDHLKCPKPMGRA